MVRLMERDFGTCPGCGVALTEASRAWRPFCSKRCKLVDLSRWLGEEYRLRGEPQGDGAGSFAEDEGGDEGAS